MPIGFFEVLGRFFQQRTESRLRIFIVGLAHVACSLIECIIFLGEHTADDSGNFRGNQGDVRCPSE